MKEDQEAHLQPFKDLMKAITDLSVKLGVKLGGLGNKKEAKKAGSKEFPWRTVQKTGETRKASEKEKRKGEEEEEGKELLEKDPRWDLFKVSGDESNAFRKGTKKNKEEGGGSKGKTRSYVSKSKMAGQLQGLPDRVLEGTFLKGLEPELKSPLTVMQPESLIHLMRLAVMINEYQNRANKDEPENYGELGDDPQFQQPSVEPRFPP